MAKRPRLFQLTSLTDRINMIIITKYTCSFSTSLTTFHRMLQSLSTKKMTLYWCARKIWERLSEGKGQLWSNVINHSWRWPPCASCEEDEETSGQLRASSANALESWRVFVPPQSARPFFLFCFYFYLFIYNLVQLCTLTLLCASNFTTPQQLWAYN